MDFTENEFVLVVLEEDVLTDTFGGVVSAREHAAIRGVVFYTGHLLAEHVFYLDLVEKIG